MLAQQRTEGLADLAVAQPRPAPMIGERYPSSPAQLSGPPNRISAHAASCPITDKTSLVGRYAGGLVNLLRRGGRVLVDEESAQLAQAFEATGRSGPSTPTRRSAARCRPALLGWPIAHQPSDARGTTRPASREALHMGALALSGPLTSSRPTSRRSPAASAPYRWRPRSPPSWLASAAGRSRCPLSVAEPRRCSPS